MEPDCPYKLGCLRYASEAVAFVLALHRSPTFERRLWITQHGDSIAEDIDQVSNVIFGAINLPCRFLFFENILMYCLFQLKKSIDSSVQALLLKQISTACGIQAGAGARRLLGPAKDGKVCRAWLAAHAHCPVPQRTG